MAVAVASDGEIIWEAGFGLADREKNIPATEHTQYPLASISKSLTATGLMILVEQGLTYLKAHADYLLQAGFTRERIEEEGGERIHISFVRKRPGTLKDRP